MYQVSIQPKTAARTSSAERHGCRFSFSIFIVPIKDSHIALSIAPAAQLPQLIVNYTVS